MQHLNLVDIMFSLCPVFLSVVPCVLSNICMMLVLLRFPTGQSRSVSVRFGEKTAVSVNFDFLPMPWILDVAAENQFNLRQNKLTAHYYPCTWKTKKNFERRKLKRMWLVKNEKYNS